MHFLIGQTLITTRTLANSGGTSVWTDFQTGSNWTSRDANLVDIGFNTIGDLLEELQIDPMTFDNQLIIIVSNTADGELV